MKTILVVLGTRPNFIKFAPIYHKLKNRCNLIVVHTEQHYTPILSKTIMEDVDIIPTAILGNRTSDRSELINSLNFYLHSLNKLPDEIIVVGDVNSTFAGAWVAKINGIPLIHIESGLRSGDYSMDEEMNRIIVDSMSDILFLTEQAAVSNLFKEMNMSSKQYHVVGNTHIESVMNYDKVLNLSQYNKLNFLLVTLHRKNTIENKEKLNKVFSLLKELNNLIPIVVCAHPNLSLQLKLRNVNTEPLIILKALPYKEFLVQLKMARCVLTDSGGVPCEAVVLGTPCIIYRDTIEHTYLKSRCTISTDSEVISNRVKHILYMKDKELIYPPIEEYITDGKASERLTEILLR
jgi:UDP-N-acetylglucosamine 2-epimerase (non-hydrolysing)